jgi:hypothetical protein
MKVLKLLLTFSASIVDLVEGMVLFLASCIPDDHVDSVLRWHIHYLLIEACINGDLSSVTELMIHILHRQ